MLWGILFPDITNICSNAFYPVLKLYFCTKVASMDNSFKKTFLGFCFLFLMGSFCFSQEGQINIDQNKKIPQLLDLKMEMSQNNAFGERYKIQIFYGNNGEANTVIKEFRKEHPGWKATIEYQTPNYKVWVGDFRNRLEADRAFLEIEDEYTSAFIFRPNAG